MRLYIRQHQPGGDGGVLQLWEQVFSTSRAVELQQPDGSATLLAHLLHAVMPQRFPALQPAAASGAEAARQPDSAAAAAADAGSDPLGALGGGSSGGPAAEPVASSSSSSQPPPPPHAAGSRPAAVSPGWPGGGACRVLVCGVTPDWSTPLGWLHAQLHAADGFLYVVVHVAAAG